MEMHVSKEVTVNLIIEGVREPYCCASIRCDGYSVETGRNANGTYQYFVFYVAGKQVYNTGINRVEEGKRNWVQCKGSNTVTLYAEFNVYVG